MKQTTIKTRQTEDNLDVNTIIEGDALNVMSGLPASSFDLVFTSPPYFHLRDYGVGSEGGEIGSEDHVDQWVDALFAICEESGRLLTPTGSLWLNLGDTYAARTRDGATRKSLLLAPERLALKLTESGWILRNKIIWHKTNHLPSPANDRMTSSWEYLYFFSKEPSYYFNLDAIRETHTSRPPKTRRLTSHAQLDTQSLAHSKDNAQTHSLRTLTHLKASGRVGHPLGKNPGDVWNIAASQYRGAHRATMPRHLARLAIKAACPLTRCSLCKSPYQRDSKRLRSRAIKLGGTALSSRDIKALYAKEPAKPTCGCKAAAEPGMVLDPFMGSGTTALEAAKLGRNWLGIELNENYVEQATARLEKESLN